MIADCNLGHSTNSQAITRVYATLREQKKGKAQ
jgi:hypothetical protein